MEEILYRGQGPHQRKGGGFSTLGVKSQEELDVALADGWFMTLPEAIDAHDNKAAPKAEVKPDPIQDNAAPTRAEIEAKCEELGIKVHHKHSDATLLAKIEQALKGV